MRIISKFHDYYDSAMGYGQDEDVVYLRETKDVIGEEKVTKFPRSDGVTFSKGVIGFCGKLYPYVDMHITEKQNYKVVRAYTVEAIQAEVDEHGWDTRFKNRYGYAKTDIKRQKSWLENSGGILSQFEGLFVDHRIPNFKMEVVSRGGWFGEPRTYEVHRLIANPCLKDEEFYKVVDPFTAFQELDMYIGGVLGNMGADMAEVDDEHRYKGHGYDKESFRQPKGRKKPRRKGK